MLSKQESAILMELVQREKAHLQTTITCQLEDGIDRDYNQMVLERLELLATHLLKLTNRVTNIDADHLGSIVAFLKANIEKINASWAKGELTKAKKDAALSQLAYMLYSAERNALTAGDLDLVNGWMDSTIINMVTAEE